PYLFRVFLVRGIIIGLRKRAKKAAEAYQQIWWDEGSPLIVLSERLHKKVQAKTDMPIVLAMRYGKPSIESGLKELHQKGVTDVLVLPLYPQHAMASTETITVLANKIQKEQFPNMKLTHFPAFYNRKEYILIQAGSIKRHVRCIDNESMVYLNDGITVKPILLSYITKCNRRIVGQCSQSSSKAHEYFYLHQCYETTKQIVDYLG